jgi:hypothetical protein
MAARTNQVSFNVVKLWRLLIRLIAFVMHCSPVSLYIDMSGYAACGIHRTKETVLGSKEHHYSLTVVAVSST